jgi:hypothetical protein
MRRFISLYGCSRSVGGDSSVGSSDGGVWLIKLVSVLESFFVWGGRELILVNLGGGI